MTIYESYRAGIGYWNNGNDYYGAGECSVALVAFGQANTSFDKAYTDASSLQSSFTNMPATYTQAASDMEYAAYYEEESTQDMINNCNPYAATQINVDSLGSEAYAYASEVGSFLQTTTP
jgi:hypothetical protein